ncbi:hypothetical protein [Leptotrichia massiliensis]|uniref:hypothetical protein n=1 Tax=Leptotrichia massiliensis TaxID=1852388 RepID=UPI0008D95AE4|nr:hypothetical protein [Leptotrichia massiliensis]
MKKNSIDLRKDLATIFKPAKNIEYEKPDSQNILDKENLQKINKSIEEGVFMLNDGQIVAESNTKIISGIMCTTPKEAKNVILRKISDKDKRTIYDLNGQEKEAIRINYLQKQLNENLDAINTPEKKEQYKYSSNSIQNINTSSEVMERKKLGSDAYEKIDKRNKRNKKSNSKIDEEDGSNLEEIFDIHHIKEKATTYADLSTNDKNYMALNKNTHKKKHK